MDINNIKRQINMTKINLYTYYISLYDPKNKKEVNLSKIKYSNLYPDTIPSSLQEILITFFKRNKEEETSFKKDNKVMQIKCFNNDPKNVFYGEVDYGSYGTEHNVKNIETNKTVTKINKKEYAGTPYYFNIYIPSNNNRALLILESKNNDGIKGLFEHSLRTFINDETDGNLKLKIESFLPEKIIDKYVDQGTLKKIRFISNNIPDELDILSHHEYKEGYVELKVQLYKEKRKALTNRIKNLIKNKNQEATKYSKIPGTNLETNDIKIEIDLNGSERTFTIGNLQNAVPAVDITNDLEIGDDGHRTFESIHQASDIYIKDILSDF